MRKYHKFITLALVLTLVVFAAAACGVPDEEEFEEFDEDPVDEFGLEEDISQELVEFNLEVPAVSFLV